MKDTQIHVEDFPLEVNIIMSDRDGELFVNSLNNPDQQPNDNLKEAAKLYNKIIDSDKTN